MTKEELQARYIKIRLDLKQIKDLTGDEDSEFFKSAASLAETAHNVTLNCDRGIITQNEAIEILTKIANLQDHLIFIELKRITKKWTNPISSS